MFLPLAHGVFGIWDEVLPVALVGGFAVIVIVAGLINRRSDADVKAKAANPPPAEQENTKTAGSDYYRLD